MSIDATWSCFSNAALLVCSAAFSPRASSLAAWVWYISSKQGGIAVPFFSFSSAPKQRPTTHTHSQQLKNESVRPDRRLNSRPPLTPSRGDKWPLATPARTNRHCGRPPPTSESGWKWHQKSLNGFRTRWQNYHNFANAGFSWAHSWSCSSFSALFGVCSVCYCKIWYPIPNAYRACIGSTNTILIVFHEGE